ncbi:hypothetical protein E0Z10_g9651 [Xylaria hypoxylon]|uniref:F-box domain-containing protein n=1 Tax=Xylaria hypoxylon TaxID=37992 RepID=A0A4Z0Y4X5_9PEZI|nr:hypothetical protein E0Z10_g9651 [Xylaria hypoxylon]
MAPTSHSASSNALLAIPLEIRRHIYGFCIPQHLTFDCCEDMYYQNRPIGWIQPLWHSNDSCDRYAGDDEYLVDELHCLHDEWKGKDKILSLENVEDIGSEDSPTGEDGSSHGMKETLGLLGFEGYDFPPPPSRMSSLPALLLLCRQINHEVETMLYEGNTFTIDIHCQGQYHFEKQFTTKNRERMRNMILVLRPIAAEPESIMDPEIWDSVLGNLVTLGVIIKQPEPPLQEWLEDNGKGTTGDFLTFFRDRKREAIGECMAWLLPIFEYLVRAVPKQTEIVVDVTEEGDTVQALEFFQKGPFRFQRLPAADSISQKVEFAWESGSRGSWYRDDDDDDDDDGPTSCRDIINDSDYDYSE